MHHTKEKGDLANLKIAANIASFGYKLLTPLSEHLPFDLVAYNTSTKKLYRIQSKYKSLLKNILSVSLSTSYTTKNNLVKSRYELNAFDILAIYCADYDKIIYISEKELRNNKGSVNFTTIRKNTKSRLISDYEDFNKVVSVVALV